MKWVLSGLFCIILISGIAASPANFFFYNDHISGDSVFRSQLPLIKIQTGKKSIKDKDRITAKLTIEQQKRADSLILFSSDISIEIRGSSSKTFPKKSYSFQLIDPSGKPHEATLLGLPSESEWLLYAPYSDKSLLRDVIAYKISRDLGRYATRTVFVELFLNGKYNGLYILEEKIKQDSHRVNTGADKINKNVPVSGGYILRIDRPGDGKRYLKPAKFSKYVSNQSTGDNKVQKKQVNTGRQPKKCNEIESYIESSYKPNAAHWQTIDFHFYDPPVDSLSVQQKVYLCNYLYNVESALKDPFPSGMDSGYHRLIDMKSFIDYFIISEVTKNIDSYRLSTYFYKQPDKMGGKLVMGPVWDFNLSMGNADYCEGYQTTGWAYEYNYVCNKDPWLVPFWWERLIDDPVFRGELKCRWFSLRKTSLSTESMLNYIDKQVIDLEEAPHRNFRRWPILGKDIWPNKYVFKSYLEEIAFLKQWLTDRLEWLDRNMPGDCSEIPGNNSGKAQ